MKFEKGKMVGALGAMVIIAVILLIMVFITTVLGGSLLKFLGMEYESFRAVFLFFVVYFIVDFPVDLLVEAFPRALRSLGRIRKGRTATLLYIALDVPLNCAVMMAIDFFMDSVKMPAFAVLGFSAALCALNLFMARKEKGDAVYVYVWEKRAEEPMESRELLREALGLYCEEKHPGLDVEDLQILDGAHGKPYAVKRIGENSIPMEDICFSVSHTAGWWVCAVYNAPVGVDIEERGRRVNLEVGNRFFSEEEHVWLNESGATQEHFLELWVRKEAYVKYLGTGLAEGLRSFSAAGSTAADAESVLLEWIGEGEKKAFCQDLFLDDMKDPEGFPLPLIGAVCMEDVPEGIKIGFLELDAMQSDREEKTEEGDGNGR